MERLVATGMFHTVALVGARDNPARPSYGIMALDRSYQVFPVNLALAGKTILGQTVYGTLAEIPAKIDMVDVFRRAEAVCDLTTQEAIAIDAGLLWLQLGIVSEQAAVLAKNVGMKVVMDRCLKIEIPRLGLDR